MGEVLISPRMWVERERGFDPATGEDLETAYGVGKLSGPEALESSLSY